MTHVVVLGAGIAAGAPAGRAARAGWICRFVRTTW